MERFFVIFSRIAGSYLYLEREDCWQLTSLDYAERFETLPEAVNVKRELESLFGNLIIAEIMTTHTVKNISE